MEKEKEAWQSMIKGMDISMIKTLEEQGACYYLNGVKKDIFRILKECGVNMIRLRLWYDPYSDGGAAYGGGGNDLETTIELAKRTAENGMELLLDLHYSDFWADPSKQIKPKAWEGLAARSCRGRCTNIRPRHYGDFGRKGCPPRWYR